MSSYSFISKGKSLFLIISLLSIATGFSAEEALSFESQTQRIGELIQQKNLTQAQIALDEFWAAHKSDKGFVDAARRIKDQCWANGEYAGHFDLCERIVKAFPSDPLSIGIQVDQVTGYIKLKDITNASAKLEQYWTRFSSDERFVEYARYIKDQYWRGGYYAEHFDLCERLVKAFPDNPLAMNIWTDQITGYIRVKDPSRAAAKLNEFWTKYGSREGFSEHLRTIKDVYNSNGYVDAYNDLCIRIKEAFPRDSVTLELLADGIAGYIQSKDISKASSELEHFWAEHQSDIGFLEAVRRIKDAYWNTGEHAGHFAVCDRIIREFPDHPLAAATRVDEITGYIKVKDLAKASEKLEQFWTHDHSNDRFVEYARTIKDAYWNTSEHAAHFAVCDRIIREFPGHPLAVTTRVDEITGYIKVKDLAKASENMEQFWTQDHSNERFVEYARLIKDAYWNTGEHAAHFAVCDRILQEFPDHPLAVATRVDTITGYLATNDMPGFEAGIEILFSQHTKPVDVFLTNIAQIQRGCRRINDHSHAIEIGNRALKIDSSHENAFRVYENLIFSYLDLKAVEQADAMLGVVLEKYATYPDWVRFLNGLADYYRQAKYYPRSIELYQTVLARNPVADQQLEAYAGMAKAAARMQGAAVDPNGPSVSGLDVDAIVQRLMTDYKDTPRLGFHVFQIAEEYYFRAEEAMSKGNKEQAQADFLKAVEIWEMNINQIADSHHKCLAYYYSAVSYQELNDSMNAINCYQQVVNSWPEYEKAWYAQYMIAKYYEKQAEQGKTTSDIVRTAYQVILDKYPQSSAAAVANRKLNTL